MKLSRTITRWARRNPTVAEALGVTVADVAQTIMERAIEDHARAAMRAQEARSAVRDAVQRDCPETAHDLATLWLARAEAAQRAHDRMERLRRMQ